MTRFPIVYTMVMPLESIFRCFAHEPAPEQRAHFDLQINLLSEGENMKRLQMPQALCVHHGLAIARIESWKTPPVRSTRLK